MNLDQLNNQNEMEVESQVQANQKNWQNRFQVEAENKSNSRESYHKKYFQIANFDEKQGIRMHNEYVSDRSFHTFTENCYRFPQFKEVCFSYNRIKDQGVKKLAENIHHLSQLFMLDLSSNRIQFGMKYFCELSSPLLNLEVLCFRGNKLGDSGLIALGQHGEKYPKLRMLAQSRSELTDQGVIKFVQNAHKFPDLYHLDFVQNQITDKGLRAILEKNENLSNLKQVELGFNQITGSGFRGIEVKNSPFMKINLAVNQIDDIGLKELVSTGMFQNAVKLILRANKITDAGVKIFLENSHYLRLEELYLDQNFLSHMSVIHLVKNHSKLPMLTYFTTEVHQTMWYQRDKWQNMLIKKGIFRQIYL